MEQKTAKKGYKSLRLVIGVGKMQKNPGGFPGMSFLLIKDMEEWEEWKNHRAPVRRHMAHSPHLKRNISFLKLDNFRTVDIQGKLVAYKI